VTAVGVRADQRRALVAAWPRGTDATPELVEHVQAGVLDHRVVDGEHD